MLEIHQEAIRAYALCLERWYEESGLTTGWVVRYFIRKLESEIEKVVAEINRSF